MNFIAEEIASYMGVANDPGLLHYGKGHLDGGHSGRYPWGSGEEPFQHDESYTSRVAKMVAWGEALKSSRGSSPFQHDSSFLSSIDILRKEGMKETDIAKAFGISTKTYRAHLGWAKAEERNANIARAKRLIEENDGNVSAAAKAMGKTESTLRGWMKEDVQNRSNAAMKTAEFIKEQIKEQGKPIDVGKGIEYSLGVSREKLDQALTILEAEGYTLMGGRQSQMTNPNQKTILKAIAEPGTEAKAIYDYENLGSIINYRSDDGGDSFRPSWQYPESMNSSRLSIRYRDDGGLSKDGTMEIRPGVADLDLGSSHYAQVRILVGDKEGQGTHYLKGMALYGDPKDFPKGVDVIFNTNKDSSVAKLDVLKPIKNDPDNPFGSAIKKGIYDPTDESSDKSKCGQSYYIDADGNKKLSLINKRSNEGDWNEWGNKVPSQFLGKQSQDLIDRQLKDSITSRRAELDEIHALTNPMVKQKLLDKYAEQADSTAVDLKAAAFPRQSYKVIMPIDSISDKEVYAPTYKDGEKLALVRYPHGGTFEIPIVTVNNKQAEGIKKLGKDCKDVVGINSRVAERLSGADFDGDTVMVIPTNNRIKITNREPLQGLVGFDPKVEYGGKPTGTFKQMEKGSVQMEMGKISNLITDMTLKNAKDSHIEMAVRHSMVVIDAYKHHLDYEQSYKDNNIDMLKRIYQKHTDDDGYGGAATLLSRAKGPALINERKEGQWQTDPKTGKTKKIYVDPKTGEKLFTDTGRTYQKVYDPERGKWVGAYENKSTGKLMYKNTKGEYVDGSHLKSKTENATQEEHKMNLTSDARTLMSKERTPQEQAYANYANTLKEYAREARLASISIRGTKADPSAKKAYSNEVASLNDKLLSVKKNDPLERRAQTIANGWMKAKMKDNPNMTSEEKKKLSTQMLTKARDQVGAKGKSISISDKEWEAIQAGAVGSSKLKDIVDHADMGRLRELATPRSQGRELSSTKQTKISSMRNNGYTIAQIAEAVGCSTSTVIKYMD